MANSSTIGALKVFLGLDSAEFEGGLKSARNELRRAAREMESAGRQISDVGKTLTLGLSLPLAAFGAATVKAASDAQEMGSAFRYVFGAAAQDVESWAKKTGDALGRSTFVLQQQALTFQQLFKQAAPTNQAAAEMSKRFTLLAQDLASFFNVTEDDALQKLRAGLVGEAEPLRAFGVFLTAAAVEAKAFQMGLAATSAELTEQDKIMARAALIVEATKDAQGDAARTADSFANRAKALKAALNELQVSLGTALLPAMTKAAEAAGAALNAFNQLSPGAQQTALAMAGVALAIGPANIAIGGMVTAAGAATKAVAGLSAGSGALKVAMTGLTAFLGPGGLIVIGLAAAGTAAVLLYRYLKDLRTASAEVTQQTTALSAATDDYKSAAELAANASGQARVSYLQEAAAKRELAMQTRSATQAQLNQARATLAQLQADNARAIAADRYNFRGDAAGTIRPALNAPKMSKTQADIDALSKSIAKATSDIANADKVIQAGNQVAVKGAEAVAAAGSKKKAALDKEAQALRDAKDAVVEYLAAEQKAASERGLNDNEVKAREAILKAHEAYLLGLTKEAKELADVAAGYRAGAVEVAKLNDAQGDLVQITREFRPEFEDSWETFVRKVEEAEEAFYRTRNAVDDLFYGIRNNDWVAAFGGLMRAIDQIKVAFDSAASSGSRMAALAGAANAIGGAIGGTVGAGISGAASGALTGFQLGGPIGAGIGAIVGGLSGIFGASKAKKRRKKALAEQARQEAERKAAELAAAKRALELQMMELSGDEAGALAARRQDELAAMDESLRALQQEVWAKEDAAEAARKAADMLAQSRSIEIQKLEELGRTEESLAMIRADELAALPPELRALQQSLYDVIDATNAAEAAQQRLADVEAQQADRVADAEAKVADAREAVAQAIQDEIGQLEDVRSTFSGLADDLAAFGRELAGGALGGASLRQQLTAAQSAFDAVKGKTDAESLAKLPDLGRALIEAQMAAAPDSRAIARTISEVRRATAQGEAAARGQVSAAERQIASLNATASALGVLNAGVLSLRDAEDRLASAVIFQSGVMREAADAIAQATAQLDQAMGVVAQAANTNTAPVAAVADSLAAASAAIDQSISTSLAAADAAQSIVAEAIVDELKPVLASIAMASDRQASTLKRWDGNGMPETRDVAA